MQHVEVASVRWSVDLTVAFAPWPSGSTGLGGTGARPLGSKTWLVGHGPGGPGARTRAAAPQSYRAPARP